MEFISEMNSANIDATLRTLGSFDSCVKLQIQNDNPVLFSVDLSETYGSHSLVVTGYKVYTKTSTVLGINFKDYVYLLQVNDNWKESPRYFDLTAFNGTWAYTTVEVNE